MADILEVVKWFSALVFLAIAGFGITWKTFTFIPLRGIYFSSTVGIMCVGLLTWLLSTLNILPNTRFSWWLVCGILVLFSLWVVISNRKSIATTLKNEFWAIFTSGLLFLLFFIGFAIFRAFDSAIAATEKPMEFMLLNVSAQTLWAPPQDAWLAGESVSYYYLGYWIFSGIANALGTQLSYAFNLSLASVASLCAINAFGTVFMFIKLRNISDYNLLHTAELSSSRVAILGGIFGIFALLIMASFGAWWELLAHLGIGSVGFYNWLDIKALSLSEGWTSWIPQDFWWWWRLSRVINTFDDNGDPLDNTIQEFPAFSFILGDLHPHVLSIPFVLLGFAVALNVWRSPYTWSIKWIRHNKFSSGFIAVLLGMYGFLNAADMPFFMITLFITGFVKNRLIKPNDNFLITSIVAILPLILLLSTGVLIFWDVYPPFGALGGQLHFPYIGINLYTTRFVHFFTVYGVHIIMLMPFVLFFIWRGLIPSIKDKSFNKANLILLASVFSCLFLVWLVYNLFGNPNFELTTTTFNNLFNSNNGLFINKSVRLEEILPKVITPLFLFLIGATIWVSLTNNRYTDIYNKFPLLLLVISLILLYIVELFFVVDAFGTRLNTVFKVYYQVWLIVSLVSAYVTIITIHKLLTHKRRYIFILGISWSIFTIFLISVPVNYTVSAMVSKGSYSIGTPTLDGTRYLEFAEPADYEAVNWILDNVSTDERLVEAWGNSYTEFARFSSYTGRPTILGWLGHERQWRDKDTDFDSRINALATLYTSTDPAVVDKLLKQYKVKYLVISCRERSMYSIPENAAIVNSAITQIAFQSVNKCIFKGKIASVQIYRVIKSS